MTLDLTAHGRQMTAPSIDELFERLARESSSPLRVPRATYRLQLGPEYWGDTPVALPAGADRPLRNTLTGTIVDAAGALLEVAA